MNNIGNARAKLSKWVPLSKVLRFSLSGYGLCRERAEEISKANEEALASWGSSLAKQIELRTIPIRHVRTMAKVEDVELTQLLTRLRSMNGKNNLSGLADENGSGYVIGREQYYAFFRDDFNEIGDKAPETNLWNNSILSALEDYKKAATDEEWLDLCASIDEPLEETALSTATVSLPAPQRRLYRTVSRVRVLAAEIEQAVENAGGDDNRPVWTELQKLAETKYGAMIGFTSEGVQYRGNTYSETGEPDILTFKQLCDRLRNRRKKAR